MEMRMPRKAQVTLMTAEKTVTDRKERKIRMADRAGKIISAEISSEPTRFMASTIIIAVITAIRRLAASTFVPAALAKFSSKVTSKMRW